MSKMYTEEIVVEFKKAIKEEVDRVGYIEDTEAGMFVDSLIGRILQTEDDNLIREFRYSPEIENFLPEEYIGIQIEDRNGKNRFFYYDSSIKVNMETYSDFEDYVSKYQKRKNALNVSMTKIIEKTVHERIFILDKNGIDENEIAQILEGACGNYEAELEEKGIEFEVSEEFSKEEVTETSFLIVE